MKAHATGNAQTIISLDFFSDWCALLSFNARTGARDGGASARALSSTAAIVLLVVYSKISIRFIVTEWFPLPAQFGRQTRSAKLLFRYPRASFWDACCLPCCAWNACGFAWYAYRDSIVWPKDSSPVLKLWQSIHAWKPPVMVGVELRLIGLNWWTCCSHWVCRLSAYGDF